LIDVQFFAEDVPVARIAKSEPKVAGTRAPATDAPPMRFAAKPKTASSPDAIEAPRPERSSARRTAVTPLPRVGRPAKETFEGAWHALTARLREAAPERIEDAIAAAATLGFALESAKNGRVTLTRGKTRLRFEQSAIGAHSTLAMKLRGPGKKSTLEREAVLMHGTLLPPDLYRRMEQSFDEVMGTFDKALEAQGKRPLPTTFDALKSFIDGGKGKSAQKKDLARDAEVEAKVAGLTEKLDAMKQAGTAPRAIVVYTDGPDGAGKSSTGTIVLRSLTSAGYLTGVVSFKAPSEAERAQHWLQRFRDRGVPGGDAEAVFWDRGPAGDAVYGDKSPTAVKKMAGELRTFERDLENDGVLLFKVHIYADQEKQARTFGKRLARQHAADLIEAKLEKRGALTEAASAALDNIRQKIDGDDLRALVRFEEHQARFARFSKLADMLMVDASKRHPARLKLIEAMSEKLDAWSASP
jgi:polyphosphate kinase 2 (PPK2 family)